MTKTFRKELDNDVNQVQNLQKQGHHPADQENGRPIPSRQASLDGFEPEAALVKAIGDDRNIATEIREEDCMLTGFRDEMLVPTINNLCQRYSIGCTDLDLNDFGAEQFVGAGEEEFPMRQQHTKRWLDRLPDADTAAEERMTRSTLNFDSSGDESSGRLISLNEVNVVLAKRDLSLFREVSGGPWELRRASEVRDETRRRKSSESSWRSDEGGMYRRRHFGQIEWAVVDELKAFSFRTPPRGRTLTRPDHPPMSPKALACKLWPERPDFSVPLEQQDIFHIHAIVDPSLKQRDEAQATSKSKTHVSHDPPQASEWFPWRKG